MTRRFPTTSRARIWNMAPRSVIPARAGIQKAQFSREVRETGSKNRPPPPTTSRSVPSSLGPSLVVARYIQPCGQPLSRAVREPPFPIRCPRGCGDPSPSPTSRPRVPHRRPPLSSKPPPVFPAQSLPPSRGSRPPLPPPIPSTNRPESLSPRRCSAAPWVLPSIAATAPPSASV